MLIPVKDENGEEAFLGTKEEFATLHSPIKEVYVCVETREGKVDQFFTSISEAKEFLETYE